MTTAAQILVSRSRLTTGTAAAHLRALSGAGSTSGEILAISSQLGSATAAAHLLAERSRTLPKIILMKSLGRGMNM